MPSDQQLLEQAQEFKAKGNSAFSQHDNVAAMTAYSQGIVACDRIIAAAVATESDNISTEAQLLKATLLSNRAMCRLGNDTKSNDTEQLQSCIDDCTTALTMANIDQGLRAKLFYRRAKARFLLANTTSKTNVDTLLQDAAKDLLSLLRDDAQNTQAQQLLNTIRAQHKSTATTPLVKTIQAIKEHTITDNNGTTTITDENKLMHHIKILLGMLDNDLPNASMELGRRTDGINLLLNIVGASATLTSNSKLPVLALQCLSQAGSFPLFSRTFLVNRQADLYHIVQQYATSKNTTNAADVLVSALAVYMRVILHADRDDPNQEIAGTTLIEYSTLVNTTQVALQYALAQNANNDNNNNNNELVKTVVRAVLDVWTTFTAGVDREMSIRQTLGQHLHDPTLPLPATQAEIRNMTPQQLAAYRQRQLACKTRDEAWAYERSRLLLTTSTNADNAANTTALTLLAASFLPIAVTCPDHVLRREMTVVLGRLLANLQDEDKIKDIIKPYLSNGGDDEEQQQRDGPIIEEIYNDNDDDGDGDGDVDEQKQDTDETSNSVTLATKMNRAMLTAALLLSKKDVGAWALQFGWRDSADELPDLINSGQVIAMCLASEVLSSAATVEASRPLVINITSSKTMEKLLMSDDRDVRSGAASAIAKLGLSTKSSDEGEVMGLLQAACDLLEDTGDDNDNNNTRQSSSNKSKKDETKLRHFSSFATSSVERAIEMITYLIAQTIVKDELAAGFHSRSSSMHSAMDLLVKIADLPNAGESLSGFGLATIFQHMAVTNMQLRKEAFEGREVTMEQYDEMQKLGKTEEEKEVLDAQRDTDTTAACNERIRKMASANVPRALIKLTEGASEHTLEQLVLTLNRMAGEASVRGLMIQQGVLSTCIKLEKNEGPTETDVMKKVIQLARHTIAKLLITTNPSLLTSAQRLGSIRPLIQLIRDHKGSDLQHFEALLAITNAASTGDDAKTRIISERGIGSLHFAMFSDHEMVRRAATEAMCNLVPNKDMMEHLAIPDNLRLWLAFASDYENNYECARAAAGCLAMATQDETIAEVLIELPKFKEEMSSLLESGRLEIMHRALVVVMNLVLLGGKCKEKATSEGLIEFCSAYADSYNNDDGSKLDFPPEEMQILPVTIELAKKVTTLAKS